MRLPSLFSNIFQCYFIFLSFTGRVEEEIKIALKMRQEKKEKARRKKGRRRLIKKEKYFKKREKEEAKQVYHQKKLAE